MAAERKVLPRLGTRKLYHLLAPTMRADGIKAGRDTLFNWLRAEGLLIKASRRYTQTTNSRHWMRKYPNTAKQMSLTAPEQLWVADITYVRTREGWMYLGLLTDAWSRKVVGYSIDDNMEAATVAAALRRALKGRMQKDTATDAPASLVHHSDRGLQYCSAEYTEVAGSGGLSMSMTEGGDPYENALAERMNRTFKEEFGLGAVLPSKAVAKQMAAEAVDLYNNRRPHLALGMLTPAQVHSGAAKPPLQHPHTRKRGGRAQLAAHGLSLSSS